MGLFSGLFGGGGASGSIGSSANTTSSTTDNKNNATSGDDASLYDTRGGNISFESTSIDAGSIDAAFGFGSEALGFGSEALTVVADSFARAATISTNAQASSERSARDSLSAVVGLASDQSKAGVQGLTENVIKWGIVGIGLLSAAYVASQFARNKRTA